MDASDVLTSIMFVSNGMSPNRTLVMDTWPSYTSLVANVGKMLDVPDDQVVLYCGDKKVTREDYSTWPIDNVVLLAISK